MLYYQGMVSRKNLLITYKLGLGLLGASALVTEVAVLHERDTLNLVNFFSYFTVLSNFIAAIVFMVSAYAIAAGTKSRNLDIARSLAATYMIVVGLGFSILLYGLSDVAFTAVPWDNIVLHYIIPLAVALDIFIDRPHTKLSFKNSLAWVAFPLAYVVYSLVRGTATGWYPYPFLNPSIHNYQEITAVLASLLILVIVIIYFITKLSGQHPQKQQKS